MSPAASKPAIVRRYMPLVTIVAVVVVVMAALGWLVKRAMDDPVVAQKKTIQQVQIIRPPPPPPEVEPPPPPESEEVDVPEPEETPEVADADEPPPGDLGLDAEGVAGSDAFGLLGRKGGRDLLSGASDGRFAWYRDVLKSDLIDRLAEVRDIRRDRYSVVVRLWLTRDGRIERFKLANSTGNVQLDRDLTAALESIDRVSEMPPDGLPQPVRLRIVSRI